MKKLKNVYRIKLMDFVVLRIKNGRSRTIVLESLKKNEFWLQLHFDIPYVVNCDVKPTIDKCR